MSNQALLSEDDLKEWLGYTQSSAVERWLSDIGIPYEKSKGKVVTTIQAVNNGLIGMNQESKGFEFG